MQLERFYSDKQIILDSVFLLIVFIAVVFIFYNLKIVKRHEVDRYFRFLVSIVAAAIVCGCFSACITAHRKITLKRYFQDDGYKFVVSRGISSVQFVESENFIEEIMYRGVSRSLSLIYIDHENKLIVKTWGMGLYLQDSMDDIVFLPEVSNE